MLQSNPSPEQLERIRSLLRLDRATGKLYWRESVRLPGNARAGNRAGFLSERREWRTQIDGISYGINRIVWFLTRGEWPSGNVSYRDGNSLNTHPDNLILLADKKAAGLPVQRAKKRPAIAPRTPKSTEPKASRIHEPSEFFSRMPISYAQLAEQIAPISRVLAELGSLINHGVGLNLRSQYDSDPNIARAEWSERFPDPWRDVRTRR